MKITLTFVFLLFFLFSFSKEKDGTNNHSTKNDHYLSPKDLAHKLTAPYRTEMDKAKSIFSWIANNIAYNIRPSYNRNTAVNAWDDANDTGALKPLSERVAEGVLRKRVAFCDGYARLFKTLCDYGGLTSELITGHAKTSNKKRTDMTFRSNHRWNAVMIDSAWYLLDVTWASGYLSIASNDFVQHFDDKYFLSPPEDFIKDHFPEDVKWTLLTSPPAFKDYLNAPLH